MSQLFSRKTWMLFVASLGVLPATSQSAEVSFDHNDGFESGAATTAHVSAEGSQLFGWKGGVRTKVTSEKAKSGKYSLRFHYPAAEDGKDSFSEQRFVIPNGASVLTISYDLYVPDNFYHRDQTSSENNKFLFLWSGTYGTVASHQSVGFEYWPAFLAGGSRDDSVLSHHLGPDQTDWGHKTPTRVPVLSVADRGQWVNFSVYVKLSSETGKDGRIIVKKNGNTLFDVQNLANYSQSGNYLDQGYLLGWSNSGFAEDTYFYVDNFRITVGRSAALPNPPVLEIAH